MTEPTPTPATPPVVVAARVEPFEAKLQATVAGMGGLYSNLAQFGAVGVVCGILWFLVAVEMPRGRQQFQTEMGLERDVHREELKTDRERFDRHVADQSRELNSHRADLIRAEQQVADTLKAVQANTLVIQQNQKAIMELIHTMKKHEEEDQGQERIDRQRPPAK